MMDDMMVVDLMKSSPLYVWEYDNLYATVNLMRKYSADTVTVLSKDNRILGSVSRECVKKALIATNNISVFRSMKVKDILSRDACSMVFYPRMKIAEAYNTMKCFNMSCVPVADVPWEKRVIGFLSLDDILPLIRKYNLKISF